MKLIIVESPAKAKTIEKFLGKEYRVAASYGHIRDLPGSASEIPQEYRDKPWARMAVDIENDFQPIYVVSKDSKKQVSELKKMVKQADELLLATDEDREGESISWHLLEVLEPKIPVKRIAFHEITRSAIKEALANPREVNEQLVRAQESRRILDRLYGYTLSPILWKKVRTKLSAGRVQSVAVRLVVDRELERQRFKSAEYWDVEAKLKAGGLEFSATLNQVGEQRLASGRDFDGTTGELKKAGEVRVLDQAQAERFAAEAPKTLPWRVVNLERKETRQRPAPPFTTSTLQQAASSALGMTPRQTMMIAQRLYEGIDLGEGDREGLITYMRTDSVTLAEKALQEAGSYIKGQYGDDYYAGARRYKTKSKSAQEAHEAIRPTHVDRPPESLKRYLEPQEYKLYRLIWNRTVASQMADAILDKTTVDFGVEVGGEELRFRANGSVVKFPGFLRLHGGAQKDTQLPELKMDQAVGGEGEIKIEGAEAQQHETQPPARYTEASLVRKLEEEGIGRPSTYAPTISTIQQRGYVVKKSGALLPTYVGMAVTELLRKHFEHYIELKFTALMEDELDEIAEGKIDWKDFLRQFYLGNGGEDHGLKEKIEEELPKIDYPAIDIGNDPETGDPITVRIGKTFVFIQRGEGGEGNRATLPVDLLIDELTPEKARELIGARAEGQAPLGKDPETGENVYVMVGPYGPYAQLGEAGEGAKPKRVSLPRGKKPEDVDLAYALKLLSLPREIGTDPETGKTVTAGIGRYGPYVERGGTYRNLENEEQIFEIGLEDAIERIKTKNQKTSLKDLGNHPETGAEVKVMSGRYGPYVTDGKVNATIPKATDPQSIEMEQAVPMLKEAAEKKKRGGGRRPRGRKKAS